MNCYNRKKLVNDINKLPSVIHEQIFELILINIPDIEYNSNSQYTFVDLSSIDNDVFKKIEAFVELCNKNLKYDEERKFLCEKAKDNMDCVFTTDYDLSNFIKPRSGVKITDPIN